MHKLCPFRAQVIPMSCTSYAHVVHIHIFSYGPLVDDTDQGIYNIQGITKKKENENARKKKSRRVSSEEKNESRKVSLE